MNRRTAASPKSALTPTFTFQINNVHQDLYSSRRGVYGIARARPVCKVPRGVHGREPGLREAVSERPKRPAPHARHVPGRAVPV